jgi:hypothetical protein
VVVADLDDREPEPREDCDDDVVPDVENDDIPREEELDGDEDDDDDDNDEDDDEDAGDDTVDAGPPVLRPASTPCAKGSVGSTSRRDAPRPTDTARPRAAVSSWGIHNFFLKKIKIKRCFELLHPWGSIFFKIK